MKYSLNYITEINSFYDWLETNPVSDSAIVLWYALMHVNNKAGWREEFAVAISTLELKTGLSKSSIIRSRNNLKQAGRIDFRSRDGQQSAVYSMIAFHTDTQSGTQSDTQSGTQTDTQSATIPKLNQTQTKPNKSFSGAEAPAAKKKRRTDGRLYWDVFKAVFQKFYYGLKNEHYEFQKKDYGCLGKIYDFLKKRAEAKKYDWTEQNMSDAFLFFLNKAAEKRQLDERKLFYSQSPFTV